MFKLKNEAKKFIFKKAIIIEKIIFYLYITIIYTFLIIKNNQYPY